MRQNDSISRAFPDWILPPQIEQPLSDLTRIASNLIYLDVLIILAINWRQFKAVWCLGLAKGNAGIEKNLTVIQGKYKSLDT